MCRYWPRSSEAAREGGGDMGLDTTHDCWHGAYSAFNRWRDKLAEVAGYRFAVIEGRNTPLIDWGHITDDQLYGRWKKTPEDPLVVLIAHSDCEGEIFPEQGEPLADRLAELLPLLPDDEDGGHIGDWRAKTQAFIDGLRAAAKEDEPVEFH